RGGLLDEALGAHAAIVHPDGNGIAVEAEYAEIACGRGGGGATRRRGARQCSARIENVSGHRKLKTFD
ncbi:hypothetical protein ABTF88_20030, partial [Acinetobacter baumannii]